MLSDCDVKVYKLVSLSEIVHPQFPVSRVLKLLSDRVFHNRVLQFIMESGDTHQCDYL